MYRRLLACRVDMNLLKDYKNPELVRKFLSAISEVVEKGKGDGIFINTAGIGVMETPLAPKSIAEGNRIVVSGTMAITVWRY